MDTPQQKASGSVTETDLNTLAQRFYDVSRIPLPAMTDKPKVVEGLRAVFTEIGIEVEPADPLVLALRDLDERLSRANLALQVQAAEHERSYQQGLAQRLLSKAEGVRLARSYVGEALRGIE